MSLASADMDFIRELVHDCAGIVIGQGKEYLVISRLEPLALSEGIESLEKLIKCLRKQTSGSLVHKVIEAMTTNETSFFRDVHPFEALKNDILPELIQKNSSSRQINIWCAACSSGQEPYCIAMLIKDNFPALQSWNVDIIATDISEKILVKARQGLYNTLEINRGLPAPMLVKYFTRDGSDFEIKKELRDMIDFREMNLTKSWSSMPAMDIIFIRNVLIYFDLDTKIEILGKMRKILKTDGYLFLGGAETTINIDEKYERLQINKTVCYKICQR